MTTLVGTLSKAGAIHKVENGFVGLPDMNTPEPTPPSATPSTTPKAPS